MTEERPDYLSPEWDSFVMSQFAPFEMMDGCPKTLGLRRVAELLLGDIISSKPVQVFPVEGNGPGRATVVYEVQIQWKTTGPGLFSPRVLSNVVRTFGDSADVWHGNCDLLFAAYAPATACTIAEGRALRKALRLRKLAAEEVSKDNVEEVMAQETSEKISNDQLNFLDNKCKKLDINVFAFINSGEQQYRSIYDVTRDTAAKMIKELTRLTNNKAEISSTIIGYIDWKNT